MFTCTGDQSIGPTVPTTWDRFGDARSPLPKVIITVIRDYIPVIVIIIRIGVSCLVLKDSMIDGDVYQVTCIPMG